MHNLKADSTTEMNKKYNRCKHELLLHNCYYHPNYRYAAITASDDQIYGLMLKAHAASNRLSVELDGEHKLRLKLRVVLTLKIKDDVLAHETSYYWEDLLSEALEELYDLFEGNRIDLIIGINPKAPMRYNLSIITECELPQFTNN